MNTKFMPQLQSDKTQYVYNGKYQGEVSPSYAPGLFSLNYSVCAFEGIRSYATNKDSIAGIFRLEEHIDRFLMSCNYLNLNSEHINRQALLSLTIDLVAKCRDRDLYIRPIAFFGEGIMSLSSPPAVQMVIMATPFSTMPKKQPLNIEVSDIVRDTKSINKKISRNYFDSYMALGKKSAGFNEVMMFDDQGFVTETSAHNIIFKLNNGEYVTPSDEYCLPGITRKTAIELLKEMAITVNYRSVHKDELNKVVACALTSTASEIRVVDQIGGQQLIGHNQAFDEIIQRYKSLTTGYLPESDKKWVTYVTAY